jgi:hypothetical protein
MGMRPSVCHYGAPDRSGAFQPAPGASPERRGGGGRRIPECCIVGSAAAVLRNNSKGQRHGRSLHSLPLLHGRSLYFCIFRMCTILLGWILLMCEAVLITQNSAKSAPIGMAECAGLIS